MTHEQIHEDEFTHKPVMMTEVLDGLRLKEGSVVIDVTVGLGGHAKAILKSILPGGLLIGIDRDPHALKKADENLSEFESHYYLHHGTFDRVDDAISPHGIEAVDAILLDAGVSSLQLDDPCRGFTFRHEAPLDMRMDPSDSTSAFNIVNSLSESEIERILWTYGEERFARRIARQIVRQRSVDVIRTTNDLARTVLRAYPAKRSRQKIHPATRTFQALRIAVNHELEILTAALPGLAERLKPGGRMAVIAFHSLEDRIVKHTFADLERGGVYRRITKKPLRPTQDEIMSNTRARSARMRILERTL